MCVSAKSAGVFKRMRTSSHRDLQFKLKEGGGGGGGGGKAKTKVNCTSG